VQTAAEAVTGLQGRCWSICKQGVNPDLTFLVTAASTLEMSGKETPQERLLRGQPGIADLEATERISLGPSLQLCYGESTPSNMHMLQNPAPGTVIISYKAKQYQQELVRQ